MTKCLVVIRTYAKLKQPKFKYVIEGGPRVEIY